MKEVTITIDGRDYKYPEGTLILDAVKDVAGDDFKSVILVEYNERLVELRKRLTDDGKMRLLTIADKDGRRAYRRSVVFLMQQALTRVYPDERADVRVFFSVGSGYFCRIMDEEGDWFLITEEFLDKLKTAMWEMVKEDIPIYKIVTKTRKARKLFQKEGLKEKERLMNYRTSSNINIYEMDGGHDYFYGFMAPSTGVINSFDLVPYEDGFILQYPKKGKKEIEPYKDFPKLFSVLKASSEWGSMMQISTVGALNDAITCGRTNEIILMQEALMEERIGSIAARIERDKDNKFIMIAGPSSSGKTTFSHRLSMQLRARGLTPHPIPLDMYYKNRDEMPLDEFGEKDFEALEGLDIEQFNQDMNALLEGKRVELPFFNFKTGKREYREQFLQIGKDDVLVIEGIHGLNDRLSYSLPKESKFKIYISALTQLAIDEHNPLSTTDGRLIRRIVRDARTRGTQANGTIAMWDSVRRGEEKNIFPFQEEADVMFNSALIYELAVLKLYAEPLLFAVGRDDPSYMEAKRLKKLLTYFLPMPTEIIGQNSLIREFIGGSCFKV